MACYRPWKAWAPLEGGALFFREMRECREVTLPCGRCVGCRMSRQRAWALRCMHEAQMHEASSFVTLTYDEDHYTPTLNYSDFQLFMRRVRKRCGATRFFVGGEYGSLNGRPHFHAILFGRSFSDRVTCGADLYRSPLLESLWPLGFSSVGDVSYESAMYVAKYATKREYSVAGEKHYRRIDARTGEVVQVVPEFGRMSLKPGIGATWFEKYWRDVYVARDGVVLRGGRKVPPPRYYDKLLLELDSDLAESKQLDRYVESKKYIEDCSPQRLAAREAVALANLQRKRERL